MIKPMPNVGDEYQHTMTGNFVRVTAVDLQIGRVQMQYPGGCHRTLCTREFHSFYIKIENKPPGASPDPTHESLRRELDPSPFISMLENAQTCNHDLKDYVGLQETFKYCTKCDHKEQA